MFSRLRFGGKTDSLSIADVSSVGVIGAYQEVILRQIGGPTCHSALRISEFLYEECSRLTDGHCPGPILGFPSSLPGDDGLFYRLISNLTKMESYYEINETPEPLESTVDTEGGEEEEVSGSESRRTSHISPALF